MGNELFGKEDEKSNDNKNNGNDDEFFKSDSNENILKLKYKINSPGEKIRLVGSKFYEHNKDKCKMVIFFAVSDLLEFYESKNDESFITVTLALSSKITDLSYMFSECISLKSISNLYDLKVNNVENISNMFYGCSLLVSLSDISNWKTNKITDMSHMFHGCSSLRSIPYISKWDTSNVTDMSYMFCGCSSLTSLDDISKWNIDKVNDISLMFYDCPLLSDSDRILNIFFQKNYILKEKGDKKMKEEEEKKRLENLKKIRLDEERKMKEEEEKKRLENLKKIRLDEERKMKEEEEKKRLENLKKIRLDEERKKKKEIIIQRQVEFKNKKISNEKVKGVLEDMCILGSIMKKEIIEEKKNKPEKFISIKEATKLENKGTDIFCLGVLAQTLENIGITTAIEKNEINNLESQKASNTILQFIMNGMIDKKKYDFHFDFGDERNNELLYNLDEQEKFNNKLRKKLSIEYNIPEDKIIITNPQKGSYIVQAIFESEDFNEKDLDINKFKSNCTEDEFKDLKYLKEIHTSLIMEGCKLNSNMLDYRGNRVIGWEEGGKRGGFDYFPPKRWKGFGLKVWDEYDNGNNDWLGMNGNENEWAVAYHGIGSKLGFTVENAAHLIFTGKHFKVGENQRCKGHKNINERFKFDPSKDPEDLDPNKEEKGKVGIGVYCSPKPDVMDYYAGRAYINEHSYKIGFMMRVKPDRIRISKTVPDYWVLDGTTNEMRPYRIMIKEG